MNIVWRRWAINQASGSAFGGGLPQPYAVAMAKAGDEAVFGHWRGAALAIGAAILFGASTPAAKVLLGKIDPWLLAAILYLGSGTGLFALRILRRAFAPDA